MIEELTIKNVSKEYFPQILNVYESVGYNGVVQDSDDCFLASIENKPVGAVRLSSENGILVLRGMMVHPDYQRKGIGKALLQALDKKIGCLQCYCINPPHLENFYGSIYFRRIESKDAPIFLQERLHEYLKRDVPKNQYIIMFRQKTEHKKF